MDFNIFIRIFFLTYGFSHNKRAFFALYRLR